MAGKIQNEDIKSSAELVSAGGTAAQLPNDDKIYVTASSINKTLKQAIIDGNIASSPLTTKGDVWTYSTVNARIGVGSNNQLLSADSTQATGLKWVTPTVSWTKYTFTRVNFSIAALTNTLNLRNLASKETILAMNYSVGTAFGGGGAGFAQIEIGDTVGGQSSIQTNIDSTTSPQAGNAASIALPVFYSATTTRQTTISLTSDVNLNTLTTGSIDIWVLTSTMP